MKLIQLLILSMILLSCGPQSSKNESSESTSDEDTEVSVNEDLIQSLSGQYLRVEQEGDKTLILEPCSFNSYGMRIGEITEYSGEWYIDYLDESYSVTSVRESEADIYIDAVSDGMDYSFLLEKEDDGVFKSAIIGEGYGLMLINSDDKEKFEVSPCTDLAEIMDNLTSSWYLLSSIEEEWVIMEPCEEAPGGFSMEDGYFDNWSGSDPYEIVKITKSNDRIELEYNSSLGFEKLILHNYSGTTIQVGDGSEDDPVYVSEEASDQYEKVVEEC